MWLALVLFCCLQFGVAVRSVPDLELPEIYKELNAAWFNSKLPEDHLRISWDSITERNGDTAFTWITNYEGEGERISIVLSPRKLHQDVAPARNGPHQVEKAQNERRSRQGIPA